MGMKVFSWAVFMFAAVAFLFLIFRMPSQVQAAPGPHPPVVIELFTSEGCSSCPPADRLLIELQKQSRPDAEIIVLSEHVDYWNYIGWEDPFSSRQFSDRQSSYAQAFSSDEVYTPQMVVDGAVGFTGSDASRATKEIAKAAARSKSELLIKATELPGSVVSIAVQSSISPDTLLTLVVTEDGLESVVKRGENAGRTIVHAGVVRALREVAGERKTVIDLKPEWKRDHLRVIAFTQDKTHRIVAAGATKIE